jgi:hypothetical protein
MKMIKIIKSLKLCTKILIIAELLDILTTFIGLALFPWMIEINPFLHLFGGSWLALMLYKIILVGIAIFILEKKIAWKTNYIWFIPGFAIFAVISNVVNILYAV